MTKIRIIVGSETGTALDAAKAIETALSAAGYQITLVDEPILTDLTCDKTEVLLICTSSTGAGELPTNIVDFYQQLITAPPAIAGRRYGVISLGDSSFTTYGAAAGLIDDTLMDIGAIRIGEPLMIDAMETFTPTTEAVAWATEWVKSL